MRAKTKFIAFDTSPPPHVILSTAKDPFPESGVSERVLHFTQDDNSHMRQDRQYFVYIMASQSGTLYIGVTNDLARRVHEHKHGLHEGFSKKYGCTKLIYFEETTDIMSALEREKALKGWLRKKKEALIRTMNPGWIDLSVRFMAKKNSSQHS
jgi:putative endonuclease